MSQIKTTNKKALNNLYVVAIIAAICLTIIGMVTTHNNTIFCAGGTICFLLSGAFRIPISRIFTNPEISKPLDEQKAGFITFVVLGTAALLIGFGFLAGMGFCLSMVIVWQIHFKK